MAVSTLVSSLVFFMVAWRSLIGARFCARTAVAPKATAATALRIRIIRLSPFFSSVGKRSALVETPRVPGYSPQDVTIFAAVERDKTPRRTVNPELLG